VLDSAGVEAIRGRITERLTKVLALAVDDEECPRVDVAYIDEADAFDNDIEKEGDPVGLAAKRIEGATFPKLVVGSTPKLRGFSLVDTRTQLADERFQFVIPCPHCGEHHPITWGGKDETHGFTAFITWSYQPDHTELAGIELTGVEYLRTLALARIVLDNFDNLQASWVTQGGKVGQLSLAFGANDMGSVMIEENVVRAAGASYCMDEVEIVRNIEDAGFTPMRRTMHYDRAGDQHYDVTSAFIKSMRGSDVDAAAMTTRRAMNRGSSPATTIRAR